MIERFYIDAWRDHAPWLLAGQVEQDLIISRVLVELYNNEKIKESLVFRGGTALNKLILQPAARYSEDIDLVQKRAEPIGDTITAIRDVLDKWLGVPKRKFTDRSAKLIYRYQSVDGLMAKLKLEINTIEHYHVFDYVDAPFAISSEWFAGAAKISTYQVDELIGTKLRALYQRRKGRDLFDLWLVLDRNLINVARVIDVFKAYGNYNSEIITRSQFEKNLYEKAAYSDFRNEISGLITANTDWDFDVAYQEVVSKIIAHVPSDPWQN